MNRSAAMALNIGLGLTQIVERRFGRHEGGMLDAARRVVDIGDQRAFWTAILEPVMPGASIWTSSPTRSRRLRG